MPETDIFRDTKVRYLGYANEVGEAFRSVVPRKVVRMSYTVAFGYVFADTLDKSWKMFRKDGRPSKVLVATGDALIWQTLASIVIPGIAINRICCFAQNHLCRFKKIPHIGRKALTVGIGLASIPIIVRPIDIGVSVLMSITYRRMFGD